MSQIQWAMWANEQAVASGAILLLGGVLGTAGQFPNWKFGIYGIVAGLLIMLLEWPRGKRSKGTTIERMYQRPLTILMDKLGFVWRNYFIRFVVYLLLCIPACIILATLLGGACLLITSVIYFVAAVKGEEWTPTSLEKAATTRRQPSIHPPQRPPPRADDSAPDDEGEASHGDVQMEVIMDSPDTATRRPRPPPPTAADKKPTRPPPRPKASAAEGIQ